MGIKKIISALVIAGLVIVNSVSPALAATKHKVQAGQTLFLLGQKYGVTIDAIKRANGLKSNTIYAGQTLVIPDAATPSRGGTTSYTQDDLYWLARAVYGEARGESYTGQVAVAAVIINRLQSGKFAHSIKGIIFEPLAFTAVADGQIYLTPDTTAIRAAREALNGADPSGGALYYWNPVKATSKWVWSRPIIKEIGNHVFAM